MKMQLQKLAQKIDALSLRERVIVFITIAFALLFLISRFALEPQLARQRQLAAQGSQDQARTREIRMLIELKLKARESDPDAIDRARLQALNSQYAQLQNSLMDMHKGLVPPQRMPALLEDILKRHGGLRLLALKTLPVVAINDQAGQKPAAVAGATIPAIAHIYKHGVEVTVQGSYPDMLRYMSELEAMQWQLFWGKTTLDAAEYPQATLTLTLHTLSLDKTWLNL